MNIIEQIKAEIERRIKEIKPQNGQGIVLCDQITKQLQSLLSFIKSLPKEKPSEDLEKELDKWRHHHFAGERDGLYSGEYLLRDSQLDIARHFAEWQKNKMMEGAICTEVGTTCDIPSIWLALKDCKEGDKVKIIIVKED